MTWDCWELSFFCTTLLYPLRQSCENYTPSRFLYSVVTAANSETRNGPQCRCLITALPGTGKCSIIVPIFVDDCEYLHELVSLNCDKYLKTWQLKCENNLSNYCFGAFGLVIVHTLNGVFLEKFVQNTF